MRAWLLVATLLATPVLAAGKDVGNGAEIAAGYNCLGCHSVDHRIVGPAYKDVAARYRNQKDAEAMLMKEVTHGLPGGKWGKYPMPAQQINEKDLRAIVRWVLAQ